MVGKERKGASAMPEPIRADKVAAEVVDWLWRERIPRGMLTVIGGRPDQGKGLFMAFLASAVTRTRFSDGKGGKRWGRVLYSAIEDSHSLMTRPRLEAAGANLQQIDLWRFRVPAMMDELEAHLRETRPDLLVIDPLASHLSNGITRHSDNIRKVTDPLSRMVEETGTACVIVEHVLKRVPQSGHPIAAIGGSSSGIVAAARMAFLFGMDPADGDRRYLACVKHNIREKPKEVAFELDVVDIERVGEVPTLLYDDEVNIDPMRMLSADKVNGRSVGRPADKRAAACEWLTNYLYGEGKPVKAGVLFEDAKQYGMSTKTLKAAAKDMEIVRDPVGGGRNCTWWLPDGLVETLNEAFGVDGPDAAGKNAVSDLTDEEFSKMMGDDDGDE